MTKSNLSSSHSSRRKKCGEKHFRDNPVIQVRKGGPRKKTKKTRQVTIDAKLRKGRGNR